MSTDELRKYREAIASKVHDAWWETKKANGFHAPIDCPSNKVKLCDLCHPDMYPYEMLPESVKDYDRVTVDTVLKAIENIGRTSDLLEVKPPHTCENCINWDKGIRVCALVGDVTRNEFSITSKDLGVPVFLRTGPDFGCVRFEGRK